MTGTVTSVGGSLPQYVVDAMARYVAIVHHAPTLEQTESEYNALHSTLLRFRDEAVQEGERREAAMERERDEWRAKYEATTRAWEAWKDGRDNSDTLLMSVLNPDVRHLTNQLSAERTAHRASRATLMQLKTILAGLMGGDDEVVERVAKVLWADGLLHHTTGLPDDHYRTLARAALSALIPVGDDGEPQEPYGSIQREVRE